jgi:FHA domain
LTGLDRNVSSDESSARPPAAGFLMFADGARGQRVHRLTEAADRVLIGRGSGCDVVLDWDDRASRVHTQIERVGKEWVVVDDGLSRNGTFVNGERVVARRRLAHGDSIRVGRTTIAFRTGNPEGPATVAESSAGIDGTLTPAQQRVLDALCRPLLDGSGPGVPATNEEIADELRLSVDGVKGHLRILFRVFAVGDLPPSQKRLRLARSAIDAGLARPRGPAD